MVLLATWVVHRVRPGFVSSVAGRFRWRWLVRCALVTLPLWVVYVGSGFVVDPPMGGRPDQWLVLLLLALVATPFQAAGEEYLFRGWLVQNVGVWFAHPTLGWVVSTVVSAALFALIHGSLDPWVLLDIAALAVAACYLTRRTGGLEAAVALQLVNNVLVALAVSLLALGLATWLLLRAARRSGIQRWYGPAATPPPAPPALPGG